MAITPEEAFKLTPAMEQSIEKLEKAWDEYILMNWDGCSAVIVVMPCEMHKRAYGVMKNRYEMAGWKWTIIDDKGSRDDIRIELTRKPHDDIREGYRGREFN